MLRLALASLLATAAVAGAPPAAVAQSGGAASAPTRTVDAGGVRLAYRSIGTGRPIVFVMGLGGTMDAWDPAFLDRIAAQGRRVIVFDNRGAGRSPLGSGTLTIRSMADDAAALIRRLRLKRPDVFGWSMGGMIAQSLAVRRPRLVRRLVLAATAPGDGRATFPASDVSASLADPAGNPAAALSLLFPDGDSAAARTYVAHLARRRRPDLDVPQPVREAQVLASATWLTGGDPAGRQVRRLRIPVLVGGGQQDRVLPVANQRRLASVIPRAQRALYPGAAHGFFVQHAASFARRVDRFLGRRR